MKIVSFMSGGMARYGVLRSSGVVEPDAAFRKRCPDLRAVLAAEALPDLDAATGDGAAALPWDDLDLLPVVPNPAKILCIGLNYHEHVQETGREDMDYPTIFTRFANTQIGHRHAIPKPAVTNRFDYEGEMAIVIGRPTRHARSDDALEAIAGFSCYCDFSVRDWQFHTTQFTPGKNFPGTGAFGPWLVTADDIPDPQALRLQTRVNGETVQDASTAQMIFDLRALIVYISAFTELEPGDVIVTGTPGGVGSRREPRLWLNPGDTVEVEIDSIGTLHCPIGSDAAA